MTRLEPYEIIIEADEDVKGKFEIVCAYCDMALASGHYLTGYGLAELARSHRCTMKG